MFKFIGKIILAIVIFFGLNLLISTPIGIIAGIMAMVQLDGELSSDALMGVIESNPLLRTLSYTLSAACGAAAAAIMFAAFDRSGGWHLGWRQLGWFAKGLLGMLLGALFITLSYVMVLLLGGIQVIAVAWSSSVITAILFDIIIFTAVAVGEELFSRGYIYGAAKKQYGIIFAVVVSSVLFALLHSMNPGVFSSVFPMLNLFLAGVMLALFREWSGGLWVPIGVHLTWNYFQGDVLGMAVSGTQTPSILHNEIRDPFLAGGQFGLEGTIVTTIIMVAVCVWLGLSIRRRLRTIS